MVGRRAGRRKTRLRRMGGDWFPAAVFGPLALVTTVDQRGVPNIAPKVAPMVVGLRPPLVGFACSSAHQTAANIGATGEFVVNVVGSDLAGLAGRIASDPVPRGRDMRRYGLTPLPAAVVRPPIVAQARVHLECRLERMERSGGERWIVGRVVGASADRAVTAEDRTRRYRALDPVLVLDRGSYARLGTVRVLPRGG